MISSVLNAKSSLQRFPEPPLLSDDNTALVKWLSGEIKRLLSIAWRDKFNNAAECDMSTEPLHGLCSFSQAMGAYALIDKGFNPKPFSSQSLENHHVGHAMMTVELPKSDGLSELFLIDPTFRQFCDPDVPTYQGVPMPGYFLAQSEKGREIIRGLLENGYIKLDAESANEYLSSFCKGQPPFGSAEEALEFIRNPPYDGCYQNFDRLKMKDRGYLEQIAPNQVHEVIRFGA